MCDTQRQHNFGDSPNSSKKDSLRKCNKPLMEKRRRQRINSCLSQLKVLVLDAMKRDSSQFSKLEKADILEMTVRHLRNRQQQQVSAAMATDPNTIMKYRAGFNECATEVIRYLGSAQGVGDEMRSRLGNHLAQCVQTVNNQAGSTHAPSAHQQMQQQQQTQNLHPLSIHIPTRQSPVPSPQNIGNLLVPATVVSTSHTSQQVAHNRLQYQSAPNGHVTALCESNKVNVPCSYDSFAKPVAAVAGYYSQSTSPSENVPYPSKPVYGKHVTYKMETPRDSVSVSPLCNSISDDKIWRPF